MFAIPFTDSSIRRFQPVPNFRIVRAGEDYDAFKNRIKQEKASGKPPVTTGEKESYDKFKDRMKRDKAAGKNPDLTKK